MCVCVAMSDYSLSTQRANHSPSGGASKTSGGASSRPKSEMKASTAEEQQKNVEELRELDHNEVSSSAMEAIKKNVFQNTISPSCFCALPIWAQCSPTWCTFESMPFMMLKLLLRA